MTAKPTLRRVITDRSSMIRVGDEERDRAAERLSAHAAAGRLTIEELEERLERVQTAVLAGELVEIEADLPATNRAPERSRRGLLLAVVVSLLAALPATALVGHPIAPMFIFAWLLWKAARQPARLPVPIERSLR
jgi:hypothetical protein